MKVFWRIFTNCNSDTAATKVVTAHFVSAGIETPEITIAPYHKGGFIVTAITEHFMESWPRFVFDALSLAQKVATGWVLSGDIAEELDAWSNSSNTSGISSVHIYARLGA